MIENYPVIEHVTKMRVQLLDIAELQIGVHETGDNTGKEIREYQKAVGIPDHSYWCVAFVVWCHLQINPDFPIPITGWSPSLFTSNVVYKKTHKRFTKWIPRGGESFGVHYLSKGRVAHSGIIKEKWSRHFHTVEGNVSASGALIGKLTQAELDELDRNGGIVAAKIRREEDIYIASDHIGGEEIRKALRDGKRNGYDKYFKLK